MRDRLVELIQKGIAKYTLELMTANIKYVKGISEEEIVADYLLENGVVVPPCKVGDKFWINTKYGTIKAGVSEIQLLKDSVYIVHIVYDLIYCYKENINTDGVVGYLEDKFEFGKTAYHTKEEAEQALKRGGE